MKLLTQTAYIKAGAHTLARNLIVFYYFFMVIVIVVGLIESAAIFTARLGDPTRR